MSQSAFGVEHGEFNKSWSKAEGRIAQASRALSSQRNPDQRKVRWLSNRKYLGAQKGPLGANSPASRAKKEMKVLGTGRSVAEGGGASIGMPASPPRKLSRNRLP